ncbi:MAG TPA: dTDP-4-amino-4,6-dideoxygalactose transaminase [Thermoleophilaceae bacterium]|nr:dTDP-4-amino-4,6-dideoxygalactose transaminase [Thermoleophilaceae bacterium]
MRGDHGQGRPPDPARGRRRTELPGHLRPLPLHRPQRTGREREYLAEAIEAGAPGAGGRFTELCTRRLQERVGCARLLLTASCTTALELAVCLAELGPGDEAVVPSFTHWASALAVAKTGAVPVFADIELDTLGLDPAAAADALTPKTRALLPTHYAGVACDMDGLAELARRHGLAIIEDAAHGVLAEVGGRPLGSVGDAGCFSFDPAKNVTGGEGGALAVNREDWAVRAELLAARGVNKAAFERGEVSEYTWVDLGAAALPTELAAAYLWAQLEEAEEIAERRLLVWSAYHERLAAAEETGLLRRPVVPEGRRHDGHIYYVLLPDREARDAAIARLAADGVQSAFHFQPLHESEAGRRYGRVAGSPRVSEDVARRLLRLPIWPGLGVSDVERVVSLLVRPAGRGAGSARA